MSETDSLSSHFEYEQGAYYLTDAFFIRLPMGNQALFDERPSIQDWSVFVHESLHYLQNISTIAGLYRFIAKLRLLYLFSDTLTPERRSLGSDSLNAEAKASVNALLKWISAMRGDSAPPDWSYSSSKFDLRVNLKSYRSESVTYNVPEAVSASETYITLDTESPSGDRHTHRMRFGSHCLNEGIAWEMQRKLLLTALPPEAVETKLSDAMKAPYGIMRAIFESFFGPQSDSENLIKIGLLALQAQDPGTQFLAICKELQGMQWRAGDIPDAIFVMTRQALKDVVDRGFSTMVDPLMTNFAGLGQMRAAVQGIRIDLANYLSRRRKELFFELPFADPLPDAEPYSIVLTHLKIPPCPVAVSVPDGDGFSDVVGWFDGHLSTSNDDPESFSLQASLGVVQTMMTFMYAHLSGAHFVPSLSLSSPSPCPFLHSCKAPQVTAAPDICKTHPWDTPLAEKVCWYGYGAAALAQGSPRSASSGDSA